MTKILLVLLLIATQTCFGQDCLTVARNKKSEHIRFPDHTDNSGFKPTFTKAAINPRLVKTESWLKGILNNYTGAELAFSNSIVFNEYSDHWKQQFEATGIKGFYYSQMRFFGYYCAGNKLDKEGESGSAIMIKFNNFSGGCCRQSLIVGGSMKRIINGKTIFNIYEKKSEQGRIDFYERMYQLDVRDTLWGSKADYYIIRNSDKPFFIPLTRKEYLGQLLKDIDSSRASRIGFARQIYDPKNEAANKAKFDEELKRIDNSKNYTKEQMAPYRKRFIETWETEQQKLDRELNKIVADTKGAKETVLEYMKSPEEWLSRTVKYEYSNSVYTSLGLKSYLVELDNKRYKAEEETATLLVYVNPAYYNKSLSPDVPQMIFVQVGKNNYWHMKRVADQMKQPGVFAPLEALLTPGKSTPVPTPAVLTSNYKLSYLRKLNSITPLVVPADMKFSTVPAIPVTTQSVTSKLNIELPKPSPKLNQLSTQVLSEEAYKNYLQDLHSKISNAISPEEKKKADEYLKNKKISSSKEISNTALAAWIQKTPRASLYLYSKAIIINSNDALAASNFAAFLIMGGLPEKAVPILKYLNQQLPAQTSILANLGNAYYRLGEMNEALKWLKQTVQKDSMNPIANKLLCFFYLKNGDVKKAKDHGEKSITKCYDHDVATILRQLDSKIKLGEIMSRFPALPVHEFPMLQRFKFPKMPATLDEMENFQIELNAIKESVNSTIADIESKTPKLSDDAKQLALMASFSSGISEMRVKAQHIILDGIPVYAAAANKEDSVFQRALKRKYVNLNNEKKAILKKYSAKMKGLVAGEGDDELKIVALELAQCEELNAVTNAHLPGFSELINQYIERQDYLSRKFYRDYAKWAPYWLPETSVSFPSIERDYMQRARNLLAEYKVFSKTNCEIFEPLPKKEGVLQEWEDEYCANFKGTYGLGPVKFVMNCNSWGIEGGEGVVGGAGMNYKEDGSFSDFYIEFGLGASWSMGAEHIAKAEAGISIKDFIKIGRNELTGEIEIKDTGVKGEIALGAEIGKVGAEAKVIEITVGHKTGITNEGLLVPILGLK